MGPPLWMLAVFALLIYPAGSSQAAASPAMAAPEVDPAERSLQDERGDEDSDEPPPGEGSGPPPGEEGPGVGDEGPGGGDEGPGGGKEKGEEPLILDSPFEALETACVVERKADACLRAGLAWKHGTGLERPDNQQAANLFDAGCLFGSKSACVLLGRMYLAMETGMAFELPAGTVTLDFGAAAETFRRGCALGSLQSCGLWGDLYMEPRALLPRPEAKAVGIKVDMIQAIQAWTDGCNETKAPSLSDIAVPGKDPQADGRSCLRLAQLTEIGRAGVRKNLVRSAHYYRRACYATGKSEYCDTADQVLAGEHQPDTGRRSSVSPRADAPSDEDLVAETTAPERQAVGSERRSVQPHRPTPRVGRFTDDRTGLINPVKAKPIRFDVEFGLGARWLYSEPSYAAIKWRIGINVWFGLLGVSLEGGFHNDSFLQPAEREYLRMMQSLSLKLAIPLPIQAEKFYGELYLVLGGGATLGALELDQGGFIPTYGARELIQLVVVTHAQRGPRQWGAVRFEQQQSLHALSEDIAEHSSQIILLFGFTFGGPGPSLGIKKVKKEPWKTNPVPGDPNPEPGTSPL